MLKLLEDCSPYPFFYWFEKISQIPRPSYGEEKIADFLEDFARERAFSCRRDAMGNVLIRVPATPGYEDKPSILLQSHIDMVCVKDPDVVFDFTTQPLQLYVDGNLLQAAGTSLGADAGTGVAVMLALADAADVSHPPLELLYTVQEEVGMAGIRRYDLSAISSRRMINLDAGDSHTMCIGSAGCVVMRVRRAFSRYETDGEKTISFHIAGGMGGHSGMDIHRGRICAGNLAGEILTALCSCFPVRLSAIETSQIPGAILNECKVCIQVPDGSIQKVVLAIQRQFDWHTRCCKDREPGITIAIERRPFGGPALSSEDSLSVASLLSQLNTGVQEQNKAYTNAVFSSSSIGPSSLQDGVLTLLFQIRAMEEWELERLMQTYRKVAEKLGFVLEETERYPCWPASGDSPLRAAFQRAHRKLFHADIATESINGGIEAGVIKKNIPSMDIVSISPTATAAHTTEERLYIDEVEPFWNLLLTVLRE